MKRILSILSPIAFQTAVNFTTILPLTVGTSARLAWPRVTSVQDHRGNTITALITGYQLWCTVSTYPSQVDYIINRMLSKINRMLS